MSEESLPAFNGLRPTAALLAAFSVFALGGCERERQKYINDFQNGERIEMRALALSRLGEVAQDEDVPLFMKAAHEPSATIRKAAAQSLGKTLNANAVDTLGELLSDPDEDVQSEAAVGLAHFNSEKSRAYLMSAYARRGAAARAAIAEAIGPTAVADAVRQEARAIWERNLKALDSGGPAERVGAAEELGRSGRSDAVERLLPLLGDDSVLLAAGAARGLGAARDRRAVTALVALLKENLPVLREAAAEALGQLGDPAAIGPLEKLGLDGGPAGLASIRALGQLAEQQDAQTALCNIATTSGQESAALAAKVVRERGGCPVAPLLARIGRGGGETRTALAVVAALGTAEAGERVAALLDGNDPSLRVAAALTLAELNAPAALPRVVKALSAEGARVQGLRAKWAREPLPRTFAPGFEPAPKPQGHEGDGNRLQALLAKADEVDRAKNGLAQADEAGFELFDDLDSDEDELLDALLLAAGRMKATESLALMQSFTADPDESLRSAACEAVGSLGTPEAITAAGKCLDDRSGRVVAAAATGLKRAGLPAAEVLAAAVERRRSERADIVRALGDLRAPGVAAKVVPLLAAGGGEAIEAARALGHLGDKSAVQPLLAQLKDTRTPARLEIIAALGELADPSAADALVRELFHERPEVRAAAARSLGRIGGGKGGGVLDGLRFDYYADVRRAVEEAGRRGQAQGAP